MADETPYRTLHAGKHSTSSTSSATLASQRAEILFACYRRGDANDPARYVAAITAILAMYDPEIMREVTDPRTGIQTSEKFAAFMPNAGELKIYCDGVAARRERVQRLGALPAVDFSRPRLSAPAKLPGRLASIFVPQDHARYAGLVEWAKTADSALWMYGRSSDNRVGIWVSYDAWDLGKTAARKLGQVTAPTLDRAAEFYRDNPARAAKLFGPTDREAAE